MRYPIVVAGENIKEQMAPYNVFADMKWNDVTELAKKDWRKFTKKYLMPFENWIRETGHCEWDAIPYDFSVRGMKGYIKKDDIAHPY